MALATWAIVASGLLVAGGLVSFASASSAVEVEAVVSEVAQSTVDASIAKTADLSQFKPGNIISDAVFFNSATMTEAQIQSFLESKVRSCRSGYTCLKDYYVQTRSIAADAMCGAYSGGGSERASRVIFKVAQACGINPQVLIVMLQKEQGLITSTAPSAWAYQAAMGQGCPDTAACDTAYYGLFNQVYGGARQMKRYANPPGTSNYFTWYAPGKTWNVQYHPNVSCGRGAVYIENQATANLYYYTPYQPNAAALAAGYGLGNGCSSYGNRNFFNYFTDWFGSTQIPSGAFFDSLDASDYVVAVDAAGDVWAYPYAESSWGVRVKVAAGQDSARQLLPVADFNGDGRRDLVVVDEGGAASLLSGDGDAQYTESPLAVDWSKQRLIGAAGDFDGDGVADVFSVNDKQRLLLWRGSGSGGFRKPIALPGKWADASLLIGGRDFTGDGRDDLIVRTLDGKLMLHRGDGVGGLGSASQIGRGWSGMADVFMIDDIDGDGPTDLLAVGTNGTLYMYRGTGKGAIASGSSIGRGWSGFRAVSDGGGPMRARVPQGGIGDLNGDGARDIVALTSSGSLRGYWGDGSGSWRGADDLASGWGSTDLLIAMGDFSGDGEPDVGRIDSGGRFTLSAGTATEAIGDPVTIGRGWGSFSDVVGGIDFDGDHSTDIIARNSSGQLVLYRGDGAGGFVSEDRPIIGRGWTSMDVLMNAGDFDGDGNADLIARSLVDGNLYLYPTSGKGSWKSPRQIGSRWGALRVIIAPGDFDGDGAPDVMGITGGGDLMLYRGNGVGGWKSSDAIGRRWSAIVDAQ
tara:strand:+ start:748 stop:3153 length:2406 start_codon:yes stop_codon:yes gene_type:complete